ncbi:MAG TPA: IclR family transcriptional regulator [Actinomycetales bacterium]|jgi:DNA-binding IclR family transcriptional regulator|nr:IclR family transcriptional regulator [Actinomycetales bacterium]
MADGGGSFERGLAVISHIAEQGETTVEETAATLGLPLSTTYRYIRQLRDRGFVTELRGRYGPGPQMIALAGRHLTQAHLAEVGVGVLREIVDAVGETAVLIVRVGSRAMCLRRVEPDKAIKFTFAMNQLLPLHAGAGQRVLLAWAPPAVVRQVLDSELSRYTDRTPDRDELLALLQRTRETGWAVSRGELEVGSVSVAVPVFSRGEVVCSLNTAGPESRCSSRTWVKNARLALQDASRNLTDSLEVWAAGPVPNNNHSDDDHSDNDSDDKDSKR